VAGCVPTGSETGRFTDTAPLTTHDQRNMKTVRFSRSGPVRAWRISASSSPSTSCWSRSVARNAVRLGGSEAQESNDVAVASQVGYVRRRGGRHLPAWIRR